MKQPRPSLYRLGSFAVDPVQGTLTCDGEPVFLRNQSFQVLLFLLENGDRVVSKEELYKEIWGDTAVTDNALVQCIAEIRRVLQDDSRSSRYIRTIPKKGYRLLAAVQLESQEEAPWAEQASVELSGNVAGEQIMPIGLPVAGDKPRLSWHLVVQKYRAIAGIVAALAITVLLGASLWHHRSINRPVVARAANTAQNVRIGRIENKTGQAKWDWVTSGFPAMLETTANHVDHLHAELAAGSVEHSASATVRGELVLKDGAVELSLESRDALGKLLAIDRAIVPEDGWPLEANLFASQLAGHLGVIPEAPANESAEISTANAEAYRYYELGIARSRQFDTAHGIELLKKAISLDPKFAMAYARIGYSYAVSDFVPDQGRPYLEKASMLSVGLPEKPRLYIAAWKAISERQYDDAASFYGTIIQRFPKDVEAYVELAKLKRLSDHPEQAEVLLKTGLTQAPESGLLWNELAATELARRHAESATQAARQYVRLMPEEPNAHDTMGMVYQQTGHPYEAIAEYSTALSLDPEFEPAVVHLGDGYYQAQQFPEAIRSYQRYIAIAKNDAARAIGYGDLATVYRAVGDLDAAEAAASQEMQYDPSAVWNKLTIAVLRGDVRQTQQLEARLKSSEASRERGAPGSMRTLAYERGWLAMHRGQKEQSLADFREALQHVPATSGIDLHDDCLARAYEAFGMEREAASEYARVRALHNDGVQPS